MTMHMTMHLARHTLGLLASSGLMLASLLSSTCYEVLLGLVQVQSIFGFLAFSGLMLVSGYM